MIFTRIPASLSAQVLLRDEEGRTYSISRELAQALGIDAAGDYEVRVVKK